MNKHILTLILAIFLAITTTSAHATNMKGTGEAVIIKNNTIDAVNKSLNNALLNSVRAYYKQQEQYGYSSPDITNEYIKFIKSYQLINQKVVGSKIVTTINANLDVDALTDATLLISEHTDSVVYITRGIDEDIVKQTTLDNIVTSALKENDFTAQYQDNFLYNINDIEKTSQVVSSFNSVDSKNMIIFNFDIKDGNLNNPDNLCEVVTTTNIHTKNKLTKTLQLTTGSFQTAQDLCVREAIVNAINTTVKYTRDNLIERVEIERTVYNYKMKTVNAPNMIITNNLLDTLKDRGFINSYKTSGFSANEVIFNIETYFTEDILVERLLNISLDIGYYVEEYSDGVLLDFTKAPNNSQAIFSNISGADNATDNNTGEIELLETELAQ